MTTYRQVIHPVLLLELPFLLRTTPDFDESLSELPFTLKVNCDMAERDQTQMQKLDEGAKEVDERANKTGSP
jgi:hypothetical protein